MVVVVVCCDDEKMEESSCAAVVLGLVTSMIHRRPLNGRNLLKHRNQEAEPPYIVDAGKNGQKKKTTSVSEGETQIETR